MPEPEVEIRMSPSAVTGTLGTVAGLLLLAHIAGLTAAYGFGRPYVWGLVPLFDLDREINVPTFFSAFLLLLAALVLVGLGRIASRLDSPHRGAWLCLAAGFVLMAYDELFSMHDGLVPPVRAAFGLSPTGIFHFAWILPATVLVVAIGMCFRRFILDLPSPTRGRVVFSAALYLGGALGFELLGSIRAASRGTSDLGYALLTTVEESLEMGGLILFIDTLLGYAARSYGQVGIRLRSSEPSR